MKIKFVLKLLTTITSIILLFGCKSIPDNENPNTEKAAKINSRLGMAYLERHDVQRAKSKFLLALEQAPKLPEMWYSMAYFLEATGNKESANQYYLKAIALAPRRGDVLNNYGTFLCRNGKNNQAIAYFLKATRDSQYLDIAGAYENAGLCSEKAKQNRVAKTFFIKALAEDGRRPTSLIELAELYYKEGKSKDSKKTLKQFLEISTPTVQSYKLERKLQRFS